MGNNLLTQIVLIVTSATIIMTYIRPAFTEISRIQDDIVSYEATVARATDLNAELQNLVAVERSISPRESRSLLTYLPPQIDNVLIMRDIQNIFKSVEIPIIALGSASDEAYEVSATVEGRNNSAGGGTDAPKVTYRDFELSFFGTYEELKSVLQGLEANAYTLEVVALDFKTPEQLQVDAEDLGLEQGVMRYDLSLRAFALPGAQ